MKIRGGFGTYFWADFGPKVLFNCHPIKRNGTAGKGLVDLFHFYLANA